MRRVAWDFRDDALLLAVDPRIDVYSHFLAGNVPVYVDADHLNLRYVRAVVPMIEAALDASATAPQSPRGGAADGTDLRLFGAYVPLRAAQTYRERMTIG